MKRQALAPFVLGCVALVATGCSLPFGQSDIPEDTPPLPGITQPAIDIHAPGRTADRMREWAEPIANETGIPVTSLEAYGNAAEVQRQQYPECGISWTTLAGIAVAALLTFLLYRGAISINFNKFFTYTGLFLIVVAAGILSYGIHALQVYGWLPGLHQAAYDISSWYDPSSWYGVLLSGIFNFSANPSWLQVIAWIAYIAIVTPVFLLRGRTQQKEASNGTPAPQITPPRPGDRHAADAGRV